MSLNDDPLIQSPCGVVVVFPPLEQSVEGSILSSFAQNKSMAVSRGGFRGHTHISGGFRGHTCARRKLRFIVKDLTQVTLDPF